MVGKKKEETKSIPALIRCITSSSRFAISFLNKSGKILNLFAAHLNIC